MSHSSIDDRSLEDVPPAPDVCEECGNAEFLQRTRPPSSAVNSEAEYVFAYHECSDCGAEFNSKPKDLLRDRSGRVPSWQEIFGHPAPYEHQKEAIPDIVETASEGGYTVMEGGCGTGKTMIALTAGIRLVRDPRSQIKRIMVLTSVKQQLRQFEQDLKIINKNLPDDIPPVRGITLVGKADLCPYAREKVSGMNSKNVTKKCRALRDQSSHLMSEDVNGSMLSERGTSDFEEQLWSTAGEDVPYSKEIPEYDLDYCPFYTKYKQQGDPLFTFGHAPNCILHPEELVRQSVRNGVCPHSAMSTLCRDADVVIANYYHAFDRNTLQITHGIIDENTLLIADEAHMLEPRVRGILSDEVPSFLVGKAAKEFRAVYAATASGAQRSKNSKLPTVPTGLAIEKLTEDALDPAVLEKIQSILFELDDLLKDIVSDELDDEYPGWRSARGDIPSQIEIPLQNPSHSDPDVITKWAGDEISDKFWEILPRAADSVSDILAEASGNSESTWAVTEVASLFEAWFERDHTNYFREITLEKRENHYSRGVGWNQYFVGNVQINSVMPRNVIGSRIEDFGAGVLMSATLEPMDVYREVTGLDFLCELKGETVRSRTYRANFPKENRLSLVLDLPKFTYGNRGGINERTETRKKYAQAILSVAFTTPGNVMVCMPSYREGVWAANLLQSHEQVTKTVLVDQSSSEEETRELKQTFFDGPPKVLVTSLRGTLTEGVDFAGDKLLACVVCGVPIENVSSPKTQAVQAAYEDQFGGVGFDYGLTVPAVRKTRQALGRVIRGTEDVGVRVVVDERYGDMSGSGVGRFLSDDEREEYEEVQDVDQLRLKLTKFWESLR